MKTENELKKNWKKEELPRSKNGRFVAGICYSKKTQFKKGEHWRKKQLFWNKKWLINEYKNKKRTSGEIAKQFNITEQAIIFWLKKFNIKRRTISETRKIKHWGLKGEQNGMYGKTGKNNPNWNGGHSPERQSKYARSAWKELAKTILKRDNYKCQNCKITHKQNNKLVVHHIKEWSRYPRLRFKTNNLITLCENCHKLEHKKRYGNLRFKGNTRGI